MSVRVRFPPTLAERIGGISSVDVDSGNVGDCIRAVAARHPELARLIWLDSTELNPVILLFHNDRLVRADALAEPVADGDEIDVIPSIEAG